MATIWAKGRRSKFICDRSGMEFLRREAVQEPGTGFMVHSTETDGRYNIVDHPQNHYPRLTEAIALRWARPDVMTSTATVSADVGAYP